MGYQDARSPPVAFAEALYNALFEWTVAQVNRYLASHAYSERDHGHQVSLIAIPPVEGHGLHGFSAFVAHETMALVAADLLPLGGEFSRPEVSDLPLLRDTAFANASAGLFGQGGLAHFLAAGRRSQGAIATYVELIRDGDLAMRRFFGPRKQGCIRVRSGEFLVSFDLGPLSQATLFDHFNRCELAKDGAWKVAPQINERRCTRWMRVLAGIADVTSAAQGELAVVYTRNTGSPLIPALVRLISLWRDQASLAELDACAARIGGTDVRSLLRDVLGEKEYAIAGDCVHFAPGKLQVVQNALAERAEELGVTLELERAARDAVPAREKPPSFGTIGNKVATSYEATLPSSPVLQIQGARTAKPREPMAASERKRVGGAFQVDSRLKDPQIDYRAGGPKARGEMKLLMATAAFSQFDALFSNAETAARFAQEARSYEPDARGPSFERSDERDDAGIVTTIQRNAADRLRAYFKGRATRQGLADLQHEHVGAAKIQLAWLEHSRRRVASAVAIQAYFRSRLFHQVLRGRLQAKLDAKHEMKEASRRGELTPVKFDFPRFQGGAGMTVDRPINGDRLALILGRIAEKWCKIPHGIFECKMKEVTSSSVAALVLAPQQLRPEVERLEATLGRPSSPLAPLLAGLVGEGHLALSLVGRPDARSSRPGASEDRVATVERDRAVFGRSPGDRARRNQRLAPPPRRR